MMQVSTLYAHSLERQLVAKRSQNMNIIKNISRACNNNNNEQTHQEQQPEQILKEKEQNGTSSSEFFSDEFDLFEAGVIPLTLERSVSCPARSSPINVPQSSDCLASLDLVLGDNNKGFEIDSKEFTDRLCKLPNQYRGGHILGSPRRRSSMNATIPRISPSKFSQSTGQLNVSPHVTLVKTQLARRNSLEPSNRVHSKSVMDSTMLNQTINDKKSLKKTKSKDKKDVKRIPSNFMYLGTWTTKQHCDRLLEQVKSGDVVEFNIKFHHHWGIAVLPIGKKATLNNLELIHLRRDAEGCQQVVKETLAKYWGEGVTARINNSRDVHKPPASVNDVVTASLKLISQPYRVWQNSEQLVAYCRYGERARCRQVSDAAKWGSLSKRVGLWMSMVSSRQSSPATSPAVGRKRFLSVNF